MKRILSALTLLFLTGPFRDALIGPFFFKNNPDKNVSVGIKKDPCITMEPQRP